MKSLHQQHPSCLLYSIIVMILAFSLAVAGCKEEDEKEPEILVKIEKSLYPYAFDTGSFWVYTRINYIRDTIPVKHPERTEKKDSIIIVRDTTQVTLDSIHVESIEKDTLYLRDNVRFYEYYNIQYHSSYGDSIYNEQLIGYAITRGLMDGGFLLLSGKRASDKSRNAELVSIADEMKIENVTYKQVVKMRVRNDQYIPDNYFLYYADRVGIVKKEKLQVDTKLKKDSVIDTWILSRYKAHLLKMQ